MALVHLITTWPCPPDPGAWFCFGWQHCAVIAWHSADIQWKTKVLWISVNDIESKDSNQDKSYIKDWRCWKIKVYIEQWILISSNPSSLHHDIITFIASYESHPCVFSPPKSSQHVTSHLASTNQKTIKQSNPASLTHWVPTSNPPKALEILDLCNCHLGPAAAAELANVLRPRPASLQPLSLKALHLDRYLVERKRYKLFKKIDVFCWVGLIYIGSILVLGSKLPFNSLCLSGIVINPKSSCLYIYIYIHTYINT